MTKKPEVKVEEVNVELTAAQQKKKADKEAEKLKKVANGMISRQEAYQMSRAVANEEVGQLANFIRDPLRVNMIQTMALVELLIDKGVIESESAFQVYLERVSDKVQEEAEKGEVDVQEEGTKEIDVSSEYPEGLKGSTQEEA